MTKMQIAQALEYIGGLSNPGKMPCFGYNIPPNACHTGMKLHKVKNSICSQCYALRGNYGFPAVKNAMIRRLASLNDLKLWVNNMVIAIKAYEGSGYFRFHDAGDIQSVAHLAAIVEVAKRLPQIRFWLPTREYSFVSQYRQNNSFPPNLTIRLSAYMIDGAPPFELARRLGVQTSGVSRKGYSCPASSQGNKCLSCRACWDSNIENINYKRH